MSTTLERALAPTLVLGTTALVMLGWGGPCRQPPHRRSPCDGNVGWDPNRPLVLDWGGDDDLVPSDIPEFIDGVDLETMTGQSVAFTVDRSEPGLVLLCVPGGLAPNTAYRWDVASFSTEPSRRQVSVPRFDLDGDWTFITGPEGLWPTPGGACARLDLDVRDYHDDECYGDSGWW